jgi:hypothetical protein
MRNVPFSAVEKSCKEGNDLNPTKVLSIVQEHDKRRRIRTESGGLRFVGWSLTDVVALLVRENVVESHEAEIANVA